MNIQKLILPAVMSVAGLVSFGTQAATPAGVEIVNTATLNYKVNNVSQTQVEAEKKLKVDVKIDFNLTRADIAAPNASNEIDVGGNKYYVMGKFNLANTTNAPTSFTLATLNGTGSETLGFTGTNPDYTALADTKDPVNSTFKLYSSAAGAAAPGTELTGSIALNEDGNASNTNALIWVLIPTSEIKGIDKDVFAVQLTATANEVTVVGEANPVAVIDNSGQADTDAVQFVFADDAQAGDTESTIGNAMESAWDALLLAFPNFEVTDPLDPTNPTKNGFIKTSVVVWDPINGTTNPKAIPGATVKYTITLSNLGASAANVVEVSDPIPTNTTFCDSSAGEGCEDVTSVNAPVSPLTYVAPDAPAGLNGSNIEATFATVAPNETSTITFTVKVD
ncbi:MAG: DUF11 domain-containing protein [Saccharospirillaceae bacterium]|nr:DUF11 domain-containing protein [Saccharospirillaceae bacterium]MCD8531023.1 DUF11 domain-containing protein [Saccharospirillaceae bacterium]